MNETVVREKPRQSLAGLWNISFGFFGIQIGFALQNANMSRIFQSLGSSVDDLPALWIAAPLTGLLVQPLIGHLSDRTWLGRLGRRRPYFVGGAFLAALSLLLMPLAAQLFFAAILLWTLDASLNISMEPFRAFVGDMLRKDQHTAGYAVQTAFIGAGAVVGSIFPWLLDRVGVSNVAQAGGIPATVQLSFWFGAAALVAAVSWTVITTREYAPQELALFGEDADGGDGSDQQLAVLAMRSNVPSIAWAIAGCAVIYCVSIFHLQKEVYLLGALLLAYGLARLIAIELAKRGKQKNILALVVGDFAGMPPLMKRLALVQFFTWSALYTMWVFTTPVVAQDFYGSSNAASPAFQTAGNYVGELFAIYNGVAAVASVTLLPLLARSLGKAMTHVICLAAGSAGFASFLLIHDPAMLVLSEVGIGIAWASVLAMPYAILASSLPQRKLGIYMGLFNVFIVVPQLLVATIMGSVMKAFFPGEPVWTMFAAALVMAIAALAMLRVGPTDAKADSEIEPSAATASALSVNSGGSN